MTQENIVAMEEDMVAADILDILIIGGGVNGAGVARDAAGRGLRVALVEAGDLGAATSSASTKLVHGGLRYLEFGAFALVRKALREREVILANAPHIARPLAFLLPVVPGGRHPAMVRAGLFLYDHLARHREVPSSRRVSLRALPDGGALAAGLDAAFLYWDGCIDDSRLVILNARDASARGAAVHVRDGVVSAHFDAGIWSVALASGRRLAAKYIVNAAGPWAARVAADILYQPDAPRLKLVQGAHIVTRRVNRSDAAWMLQQPDGRIVFVIPYQEAFSLIGTTETEVDSPDAPAPTLAEEAYLLAAVNRSLARPLTPADIAHRFAGIRPLVLEEGKTARETTREWRLVHHAAVPATTIVGGKITTYRLLAEDMLRRVAPQSRPWTRAAPLPGGDIPRVKGISARAAFARWLAELQRHHPDYDPQLLARLANQFGSDTPALLADGLGENLGGIFAGELAYMRAHEWAKTAEDVLWRRTGMGLHLSAAARERVRAFMGG